MVLPKLSARASPSSGSHQGAPPGHPRQLDPTNEVRMVYDNGKLKLFGPAEAVGRCAGEMQLVIEGRTAIGPNAATTDRKERRAKAKVKAKKLAEGRKEGAAFAAPPTSPDSQSSEEER